jgi:DNA-binding NarL/FixJ family response regulator
MLSPISILIAEDHGIVRAGLRNLFQGEKDMAVLAEADNGRAAVQLAKELAPAVVVMDIAMPDLNGIEATRQIVADAPATRVVALSAHTERHFVTEALRAGAVGYLPKTSAFDELVTAVRWVAAGKVYLSPGIIHTVIDNYVHGEAGEGATAFSVLSTREREVLQLMAEGQSTKEMGRTLHVSVKTVETHRAKLMDKLNLHTVAGLTKYAIREGLTSVEISPH